jgi:segregation and condensation protein A
MATSVPDPETGLLHEQLALPYSVKLPAFEGPLDLLLHLIKVNEVEITDIPVHRIGEQYLRYLDVMRELNLDVVGEYLVMAATLAWIKSRMLLPAERVGEDGEEIDPRAELVARLLEYQRFKEVAQELGERKRLERDVWAARGAELDAPSEGEREIEVGLFDLVEAYRRVLEARRDATLSAHAIEAEEVTIRERMLAVMQILEARAAVGSSIELDVLLAEEFAGRAISRSVVVCTFIGMLELTRLAAIRIYQSLNEVGYPEGPIHLRLAGEPGDRSWAEDLPELM